MNIKISNDELETKLRSLIREERKLTNEILSLISLADTRRMYLDRGYPSLFEWLTKHFGYSESAAQRRIQAARLLKSVPEIKDKIQSGEVNLTTISKAQSAIRQQEKISGHKLTSYEKSQVIEKIENKSSHETEKALLEIFPQISLKTEQERKTAIDAQTTRLALNLSDDTVKDLERAKDLLSHTMPDGSLAQVIDYIVKDYLKRKDPLRKISKNKETTATDGSAPTVEAQGEEPPTAAAAKQCVSPRVQASRFSAPHSAKRKPVPAFVRSNILKASEGKCSYTDPRTGKTCGSSFQLEIDHIWPRALGGGNEPENLRCLCRYHNQLAAQNLLGAESMSNRIRQRQTGP